MSDFSDKLNKLRFTTDGDKPTAADAKPPGRRVYSISELSRKIKALLQEKFDLIWVSGEISNLFQAASGHLYFDLKDANAQIRAVTFRAQAQRLPCNLEDGLNILAMGRISLYEKRGNYQLIVEYAEPAGVGVLQKQFEQLKKRLHEEGLFDDQYKQKIPYLPSIIGIVTSLQGAVIHDMQTIFNGRFENRHLRIAPSAVQGAKAPDEIAAAIELLNQCKDTGLIILARGGGSFEDLNAFNSEIVARAIFNSKIPIISAIGHETDFTIADFTADLRAPTPTAAAEMALPDKEELRDYLQGRQHSMCRSLAHQLQSLRQTVDLVSRRLKHPKLRLERFQRRLDELTNRLRFSGTTRLRPAREQLAYLKSQLTQLALQKQLSNLHLKLELIQTKLLETINILYLSNRHHTRAVTTALKAYNPLDVLKRGYSITRTMETSPQLVTDSDAVAPKQKLEVLLAKGRLTVEVKKNR